MTLTRSTLYPSPLGIRAIVYTVPFVLIFVAAYAEARRAPASVVKMLAAFCVLALVEAAFAEEQNAWYRSDTSEQGKWRRIRAHINKSEGR